MKRLTGDTWLSPPCVMRAMDNKSNWSFAHFAQQAKCQANTFVQAGDDSLLSTGLCPRDKYTLRVNSICFILV